MSLPTLDRAALMRSPPIRTPGPPGFMQWLQRESQPGGLLPGVFQHVRSHAPALITRAALHGFGQDLIDTSAPIQDVGMTDVLAQGSGAYIPDIPAADPSLPGGSSGGWADSLAQMVTPLVTGVEQIKLFNTQLSLAQQGRPPLNTSQIRLPGVPVNVSLAGMPSWLLPAGIAAVLGFLFLGRRR